MVDYNDFRIQLENMASKAEDEAIDLEVEQSDNETAREEAGPEPEVEIEIVDHQIQIDALRDFVRCIEDALVQIRDLI